MDTTAEVVDQSYDPSSQNAQSGIAVAEAIDTISSIGIASIEQTETSTADGGTNIITVTLTDDTAATFSIKKVIQTTSIRAICITIPLFYHLTATADSPRFSRLGTTCWHR